MAKRKTRFNLSSVGFCTLCGLATNRFENSLSISTEYGMSSYAEFEKTGVFKQGVTISCNVCLGCRDMYPVSERYPDSEWRVMCRRLTDKYIADHPEVLQ